jgi:hypothetical protein
VRRVKSMWGESGPRPAPLLANADRFGSWTLSAETVIQCTVDEAWELITDVTRIGEFSPECQEVRWTRGTSVEPGNSFDGTNRAAVEWRGETYDSEWTRPCTVTVVEPRRCFAYTVGDRYDGTPASDWEFTLSQSEDGCKIVQTFRHRRDGLSGIRVSADAEPTRVDEILEERTAALLAGMEDTLRRMKVVLTQRDS